MENQPAESSTITKIQAVHMEEASWPLIDDENVVAMTEKSYTDYMNERIRGVVLLFYDSNCPTCRKLAPEYAAVAKMLRGDQAIFGMVDADEAARGFFIRRYPTMSLISADGIHSYYNFEESDSTREAIITWVKRKMTIGIYSITNLEDAERIFNAETRLVLGFVDTLEGPESGELAAVAELPSGTNINFYQTARADVAEFFHIDPHIKRPALIFLERVSGKYAVYDGQFTRVPIANFVATIKLRLLVTFVLETARPDIHLEHPPKQLLRLNFVTFKMDFKEAGLLVSDELEVIELAPVIIAYTASMDGEKYILKGELTFNNIKAFAEDFIEDKVLSESADAVSDTLLRLPSRFLSNSASLFLFPHKPQGWNLQALVDYMTTLH